MPSALSHCERGIYGCRSCVGRKVMLLINFSSGSNGVFPNIIKRKLGLDRVRNHWCFYFAHILAYNCISTLDTTSERFNKLPTLMPTVQGRSGPTPGLSASQSQTHSPGLYPASHCTCTQRSILKISGLLKHETLSWFSC